MAAQPTVSIVVDQSRVQALIGRISRMRDPSLQRAAFIAYEALRSVGQHVEVDTIEYPLGRLSLAVHPTPALRRIVDDLVKADW